MKKVRCPHCREINEVDVQGKLTDFNAIVVRRTGDSEPMMELPKDIAVACANCGKQFKVKL